MADYTKGTGSGGTMLIRDLGLQVQFHIQAGSSATYVGSPGFGTNAYTDGAWRGLPNLANYSNREWRHLGSHNQTSTGDVCFHIDASGTSGFGGPTDFWQNLYRAPAGGAPNAPNNLRLEPGSRLHRSIGLRYDRGGTNGSAITADIVEWSRNSNFTDIAWQDGNGSPGNGPAGYSNPAGAGLPDQFMPGTTYWVRARSDSYGFGWSPNSGVITLKTLPGMWVRVAGVWKQAIPYVRVAGVWKAAHPHIRQAGAWVELDK